ncbi:MAG: prepilin-type N-terminal cleavage/methylation domain-containing protein [Bythopirellula sp.]|nr:prepilin-type N-terminal cleavage/methylation domain-containing protein [Bythopirellula sp.]
MTIFPQNRASRALTLVEMLVGMAITLVMMAAVVNLFANISEGVRNRRATMEVSANLRIARSQLFNDLAGATCLKYPKNTHGVMPKPDSNNPPDGYFEIVEGRWSDDNPGGGFDPATSLVPSSNRAFNANGDPVTPGEYTDGRGRGDYDDILAMTVESESTPFRGKGRGLRPGGDPSVAANWQDMAISSPVAEVVWFATQNPTDRSEGEPGMRKVYRRTLLVTPWYGTETKDIGGTPQTGSDPLLDLVTRGFTTFDRQVEEMRRIQEEYDISLRLDNGRLVPNSLADLARREHRFAHAPNNITATPANLFPHYFPYNVAVPNTFQPTSEVSSSLRRLDNEREGEDLILNDVLAFDVQVYDPGAPLFLVNYSGPPANPTGGSIVQPSDLDVYNSAAQAATARAAAPTPSLPFDPPIQGFGTYVDLGWDDGGGTVHSLSDPSDTNPPDYQHSIILRLMPNAPAPLFQRERILGWHPRLPFNLAFRGNPSTYDTWTTYYETDGVDQDLGTDNNAGTDQGANGLDDDVTGTGAFNGPDDPLERETSPPYPSPLYGVQVKLRVYEPESRQIRETTVTRNLAK